MSETAKRFLYEWMYTQEALSLSDRVTYVVGDIISLNWHGTLGDIIHNRMSVEKWIEIVEHVKILDEAQPIMAEIELYEGIITRELERMWLYVRV